MRGKGGYGITGRAAAEYIEGVAKILRTDLKKRYDLEQVRDILSKGTPLSKIVREMRES